MDEELKKCPFCGGVADEYFTGVRRGTGYTVFVKCEICGSSGKAFFTPNNPSESGWSDLACKEAIRAWNRRI